MQGGHNWMGGVEYIKNIAFALASPEPPLEEIETDVYAGGFIE